MPTFETREEAQEYSVAIEKARKTCLAKWLLKNKTRTEIREWLAERTGIADEMRGILNEQQKSFRGKN